MGFGSSVPWIFIALSLSFTLSSSLCLLGSDIYCQYAPIPLSFLFISLFTFAVSSISAAYKLYYQGDNDIAVADDIPTNRLASISPSAAVAMRISLDTRKIMKEKRNKSLRKSLLMMQFLISFTNQMKILSVAFILLQIFTDSIFPISLFSLSILITQDLLSTITKKQLKANWNELSITSSYILTLFQRVLALIAFACLFQLYAISSKENKDEEADQTSLILFSLSLLCLSTSLVIGEIRSVFYQAKFILTTISEHLDDNPIPSTIDNLHQTIKLELKNNQFASLFVAPVAATMIIRLSNVPLDELLLFLTGIEIISYIFEIMCQSAFALNRNRNISIIYQSISGEVLEGTSNVYDGCYLETKYSSNIHIGDNQEIQQRGGSRTVTNISSYPNNNVGLFTACCHRVSLIVLSFSLIRSVATASYLSSITFLFWRGFDPIFIGLGISIGNLGFIYRGNIFRAFYKWHSSSLTRSYLFTSWYSVLLTFPLAIVYFLWIPFSRGSDLCLLVWVQISIIFVGILSKNERKIVSEWVENEMEYYIARLQRILIFFFTLTFHVFLMIVNNPYYFTIFINIFSVIFLLSAFIVSCWVHFYDVGPYEIVDSAGRIKIRVPG